MKMKKSFKRPLAFVLAFALLATAIGIGAYLTDSDVKKDVYTVGNVQAEIVSNGDMELDNVGALLPGTVHAYERAAMNTGINDAYVFMSLTIPYEMVGVSDTDGTQIGERVRQLFIPGHADGFIGSEWKLVDVGYIGQYEIEDNGQYCGEHDQYSAVVGDTITYVYGFIGDNADGSLKALASGETTSNLVETMELTNLYNASKITGEVSTKLYAIQSANVNGGLTDVNGVWAVINKALVGAENDATATLTYSVSNSRTGEAVGYAPLKLVDENGNVVATSVANESGNGQFQNVPAGDYAIETAVGDLAVSGATGYAMRRVAANVTVTTDSYVDLAFTAPSTTLIKGTEFNALIPAETTSLVFTTGAAGAGAFDVSEGKDGSVMAWVEGTTMYVSAVDGGLIYANADSDYMLKNKSNLTNLDLANIDFSGVYHGQHIFNGCGDVSASLKDMDLSNMYIGAGLFYNCSWLTEYTIPEGLGIIDKYMFYKTSISSIVIPSSVESIGHNAFGQCQNLTSVVIEDGATYIDSSAFYGCRTLTSVTIPASVTYIGDSAFANCTSLASINYLGTQEQWNAIQFGTNWNRNTAMNPIHKCESVCPDCKGCLDVDCKESVCSKKCSCGTVAETGSVMVTVEDYLDWSKMGNTFYDYEVNIYNDKLPEGEHTYRFGGKNSLIVNDLPVGEYKVVVAVLIDGGYYSDYDYMGNVTVSADKTNSCTAIFGTKPVTNYRVTFQITDNNDWKETPTAYRVVLGDKAYSVELIPGKSGYVNVPNGTYDVTVYAVFADGSESTSIQNVSSITVDNKAFSQKIILGELKNYNLTLNITDTMNWGDKSVDHYQVILDNGASSVDVPVGQRPVVSLIEGSHQVEVIVHFKDGSSMSMKSNGTQSVSAINLTKDMTSTITLGYRATVSITDNLNLGQSVTNYTVRIGSRGGSVSAGKSGTIYVGNGTYGITVIATLNDKSTVDVTEYVDIKTVEINGNTTLKLTLNGAPEVPETSGVTFAIVDNIARGQSVNEYQIIINNKEYNAFATGETKVTNAIEIPNGTYTYYVCVILKDGSMQIANDGFELIISGEGEYTIVLQN